MLIIGTQVVTSRVMWEILHAVTSQLKETLNDLTAVAVKMKRLTSQSCNYSMKSETHLFIAFQEGLAESNAF